MERAGFPVEDQNITCDVSKQVSLFATIHKLRVYKTCIKVSSNFTPSTYQHTIFICEKVYSEAEMLNFMFCAMIFYVILKIIE